MIPFSLRRSIGLALHRAYAGAWTRLARRFGFPRMRARFEKVHGYPLNLDDPRSFSERIVRRKVAVRDPLLPETVDKVRVRDYVTRALGPDLAERVLIPLMAVARDPARLPFETFERPYIVKANHGCRSHVIVRDPAALDRTAVIRRMRRLLSRIYGAKYHEWAYSRVEPRVLAEELVLTRDGSLPKDYKFHMVRGQCLFAQVDYDRAVNLTRTLYTADWEQIPAGLRWPRGAPHPPPEGLPQMLDIASRLSRPFEYVRVDLYAVEGRVLFSELTHYPASGNARFDPVSFDHELGERWAQIVRGSDRASDAPI